MTATVERLYDSLTDSTERYDIELCFSSRRYSIADTDPSAECDTRYPSRILSSFVDAFDERFMQLAASASPADVFDEPLIFSFEM